MYVVGVYAILHLLVAPTYWRHSLCTSSASMACQVRFQPPLPLCPSEYFVHATHRCPGDPYIYFVEIVVVHYQVRIVYLNTAETISDSEVKARLGMKAGWDEPSNGAPRVKRTGNFATAGRAAGKRG